MRTDEENIMVFGIFVGFCLLNWRHKSYNTKISEIFKESDEAVDMLLLEIIVTVSRGVLICSGY